MPALKSKEFYDLMELFEMNAKSISRLPRNFEKEPKELWRKGHYYTNGDVNLAFEAFMRGYEAAKSVFMVGDDR